MFVEAIIDRMVFDGEKLSELMEPLGLGWKERTKKELELMEDLIPLLKKLAGGREIAGWVCMSKDNPNNTINEFNELLSIIQQAHKKVYSQINTALIELYWQIGKRISEKVKSEAWGKVLSVNWRAILPKMP